MIASIYFRRCESYRMYLECDNAYQTVMIVCKLKCLLISQIVITCIHLCNLAIFFTHNTQYSLLLLIHVQVQCDLAITRFTCVNVCVFLGSMCLKFLLRDDFESSICWLDPWLSCMLNCIHINVFPFLKNWFLSNLDRSLTPLNTWPIYRALKLFFITISTLPDS